MRVLSPKASHLSLAVMALLAAGCGDNTQTAGPRASTQLAATVQATASSFGLTQDANFFTVDTGAGLVFKIRRVDASSTTSPGDIASLVYKGVQYQDASRGSQINSGFDWLYNGISAVTVNAETIGADTIKVTVQGGSLTHYYIARRGENKIYMGTYFTKEPEVQALVRYILRVPIAALPNGPAPSDLRATTTTVESGDIFGMPNGETRSKHYSNMRLKDWQYIGATGANVGLWIVRDNNEGNSGGPFYRSLLNQGTSTDQEITYIVNYGEAQTEPYRLGILNAYTLVFTDGETPGPVDTSFFGDMGMSGYVGPAGRGEVKGSAITGRDTRYDYTVGFSNATAQYWTPVDAVDGHFDSTGMLPGTYTMKVYKNELEVDTRSVTVSAGGVTQVDPIAIAGDPSSVTPLWRIGDWDGAPTEFINGDKLTTMHPSDVRMASWKPGDYTVGVSAPSTGFPAYQWKDAAVSGPQVIKFSLRRTQLVPLTLRVGITTAYAGGRPTVQVNGWSSALPAAPSEPSTRTLTIGSYRGNNKMYTFNIPASELVVGTNVLTLTPISGSSGAAYLSPGFAYDAVDLIPTP